MNTLGLLKAMALPYLEVVIQPRSPDGQLDIKMVTIPTVLLNAYGREVDFNTSYIISGKTGERGKPSLLWEDSFLLIFSRSKNRFSRAVTGMILLQSTGQAAGVVKFGLGLRMWQTPINAGFKRHI